MVLEYWPTFQIELPGETPAESQSAREKAEQIEKTTSKGKDVWEKPRE